MTTHSPTAPDSEAPLFSVEAVNLTEHADNPVHTESGGIAAGFGGAIVAGTTVYAYLVHAAVALYGPDWILEGGGTLTLRAPVLAGAPLRVRRTGDRLTACVGDLECARLVPRTTRREGAAEPAGKAFEPMVTELGDHLTGYASRCGDPNTRYNELGVVHPVVWLLLANRVFSHNLVRGPWVHTRSEITHCGRAEPGSEVRIEATEIDRFSKPTGERAVVAIRFVIDDEPVAFVEHTAII